MTNFEDLFVADETIKKRSYSGYTLEKEEELSLLDIEKTIAQHKVTRHNKTDMLEFLENLHTKILMIKHEEYEFEGDNNLNVNEYLARIQKLMQQLNKL